MSSRRWLVAVGVTATVVAGCAQFRPPLGGGGGGGGSGGGGGAGGSARCAAPGFGYTYADALGTQVDGDAGGDGAPLRLRATLGHGAEVYAGVGLVFAEPKAPVDASAYRGLAFVARRVGGATTHLRLKVPDAATDPAGGVCTECYNDFGAPMHVTDEWTRFEVAFADLVQETGWGVPRPQAIDASRLYGVQWQVATAGATVDVEIDDVTFLGCE